MSIAIESRRPTGVKFFTCAVKSAYNDLKTSRVAKGVIGFALGLHLWRIYSPLTERLLRVFGHNVSGGDPFNGDNLVLKIILTPIISIYSPIVEEKLFRGKVEDSLQKKLESIYLNRGFSESKAKMFAKITTIFFSALIFGLIHFTNAIFLGCSPMLLLPQVIAATFMGLFFSLAKEWSGGLDMPIGMHIGNNLLACFVMYLS